MAKFESDESNLATVNKREQLENLLKIESTMLGRVEAKHEQIADLNRSIKQVKAEREKLSRETKAKLLRTQVDSLEPIYTALIKSAETEEKRRQLLADWNRETHELLKQWPENTPKFHW